MTTKQDSEVKWMVAAAVIAFLGVFLCSVGFWPAESFAAFVLTLHRILFVSLGAVLFLSSIGFIVFLAMSGRP